jgi:hypothetical protein
VMTGLEFMDYEGCPILPKQYVHMPAES